MRIEFARDDSVNAAIARFEAADDKLTLELAEAGRDKVGDMWSVVLADNSDGAQDLATLASGAHTVIGGDGFVLYAGESATPLSGGLVPADNWWAVEFGARTRKATFETTSRKGNKYMVTKMINRGLPNRQKFGRVAFKGASKTGTKLVGAWVDAILGVYRPAAGDDRG